MQNSLAEGWPFRHCHYKSHALQQIAQEAKLHTCAPSFIVLCYLYSTCCIRQSISVDAVVLRKIRVIRVYNMQCVSFSQLGSAAASLHISLVTPEKRIKCHRYQSTGTTLSDLRSQVLLLNADIGSLSRKIYHHAPMDPYRPRSREIETVYPPTLADETFWSNPSTERDAIYNAIALVFWDLVAMTELAGFSLRSCILKKMELNRKKYKVELCKVKD